MALPMFRIKAGVHDASTIDEIVFYKVNDIIQANSQKEVSFFRKYKDKFEELIPGVNTALNTTPTKSKKLTIDDGEIVKDKNESVESVIENGTEDGVNWSTISAMTVPQLIELAADNEIDLKGATGKLEILKVLKNSIVLTES